MRACRRRLWLWHPDGSVVPVLVDEHRFWRVAYLAGGAR